MTQEPKDQMEAVLGIAALNLKLAAQCCELAINLAEVGESNRIHPVVGKLNNLGEAVASGDLNRVREDILSLMAEMEALPMFCQRKTAEAIGIKTGPL